MKNEQPRSLTEVLEWKEKAYQKVAHLPPSEALLKRLDDSMETVKKLRLRVLQKEKPAVSANRVP
jgi:hypothetical protein